MMRSFTTAHGNEARRIAANIAKLPELVNGDAHPAYTPLDVDQRRTGIPYAGMG
jgi:hypothetical protein